MSEKSTKKILRRKVPVESSSSSEDEETKFLPVLFKIDTNNKERMWKCWVIGDTIYREYGLVNGKHISTERTFEGKSIGKKNETTPEEQAWSEANKEWIEHIDKEYLPADDDEEGQEMMNNLISAKKKTGGHNINSVSATSNKSSGGKARAKKNVSRTKESTCMVDEVKGGFIKPLKCQTYELDDEKDPHSVKAKVAKYFKNPFYAQHKIDGWRCIVRLQTNDDGEYEIAMTSNSCKQFPWFESLRIELLSWLSKCNPDDLLDGLDGELFAMEIIDENGNVIPTEKRFSEICSICGLARSEPHPLEDQLEFHCFDLVDKTGTYTQEERYKCLNRLFKALPKTSTRIHKVPTEILNDVSETVDYLTRVIEAGYEGAVFRTKTMKYKCGTKSIEMRKFKLFIDEEYKIIGLKVDKGVSVDQFVFVMVTDDGEEFSAKPRGTTEEKELMYKNRKDYIGLFGKVRFQEFSEIGVPRFPVFIAIRSGRGED